MKPAEQSPLTAIRLAELWVEAGGPAERLPGADHLRSGGGCRRCSSTIARVRKLTFTGSTEVGNPPYAQAARTMKRVSLELGGHAPFLVFEDADVAAAVQQVMASKFRNAGQTCVCANRIYVHDRHPRRVRRAASPPRCERCGVGDPLERIDANRSAGRSRGPRQGARRTSTMRWPGARAPSSAGQRGKACIFEPTVLTGVVAGMRILEEETFGPVAPLVTFIRRSRGRARRQRHAVRPGRLHLDARPRPRIPRRRSARLRHRRRQRRPAGRRPTRRLAA